MAKPEVTPEQIKTALIKDGYAVTNELVERIEKMADYYDLDVEGLLRLVQDLDSGTDTMY